MSQRPARLAVVAFVGLGALAACAGGGIATKAAPVAAKAAPVAPVATPAPEVANQPVVDDAANPWPPPLPIAGTGAILGTVFEKATGHGLRDVTVVATSPALAGSASASTDAHGRYFFTNLPPGLYLVACHHGGIEVRLHGIAVRDAKRTPATIRLDTAAPAGTVINHKTASPIPSGLGIQGVVRDKATGAGVRDVTVVVTAPALAVPTSRTTDAGGQYTFDDLAPDVYELAFYYDGTRIGLSRISIGDDTVRPVIQLDKIGPDGSELVVEQRSFVRCSFPIGGVL